VMSCDNLPSNGRTLRQVAMDYAALSDDALASWIGRAVQFPRGCYAFSKARSNGVE
jgi:fructuronate reductase